MKTHRFFQLLVAAICCFYGVNVTLFAQNRVALVGSGKVLTKTFDSKNFDKLRLEDFNGKISVEVGKPFAVEIEIDDNLADLLEVKAVEPQEHLLQIGLKNNKNNRLWLEECNIHVKISMPEMSVFSYRGNANANIDGIMGRYFRIEHSGNGNVRANGRIDEMEIMHEGNGDVDASKLIAKEMTVKSAGNGDVKINCLGKVNASKSGNGDIYNQGKILSVKKNYEVEEEEEKEESSMEAPVRQGKASIYLQNTSNRDIELKVKYYPQGSYGITVKARSSVSETLPFQSEIYKGSRRLLTVAPESQGKTFTLP